MKFKTIALMIFLSLFIAIGTVHAQLSASHTVGDQGLLAGSQAPAGFYLNYFFYNYDTSKIVGKNGAELTFPGSVSATAHVFGFLAVTKKQFLGATYGASAFF